MLVGGEAPATKTTFPRQPICNQKTQVRTILRLRPVLETEQSVAETQQTCIQVVDSKSVQIANSRNQNESFVYTFDSCLDSTASQDEVFQLVSPAIQEIFEAKNSTIFAYGITGAGKTFTMDGTKDQPGIIPRAARRVFDVMKRKTASSSIERYSLSFSHLEIYNEKVYDLSRSERTELAIRQDALGNIVVADLTDRPVNSYDDFEVQYKMTRENRFTASTSLNACSSRSHSVLRLTLTRTKENKQMITKLHLIDLAGSEDNRKTGNNKDRMIESGNINKSLFMLNQVVDALNNGASNIPYRNSKLTRLLQDSLGGRAEALMIVNVAPGAKFYLDTLNTLKMAKRTRQVVNQPLEIQEVDVKRTDESVPKRTLSGGNRPLFKSNLNQLFDKEFSLASKRRVPAAASTSAENAISTTDSSNSSFSLEDLLLNATPHTKQGIMKALKKTEGTDDNLTTAEPSRKRLLGDLLADYPLRNPNLQQPPDSIHKPKKKKLYPMLIVDDSSPLTAPTNHKRQDGPVTAEDEQQQHDENIENIDCTEANEELLRIVNGNNVKGILVLKGIGVNRAQSIVDYYQTHGPFLEIDDLKKAGLGDKVLKKLRQDFVCKWQASHSSTTTAT